jgi:hypothetical protein
MFPARTSRLLAVGFLTAVACGKQATSTRIASGDVPTAAALEQFVTGAGGIRLGMTEQKVNAFMLGRPWAQGPIGPPLALVYLLSHRFPSSR